MAEGLAVVQEGVEQVGIGEEVRVMLLDDLGLGSAEAGYLGA
jgi:molybdopterin biosynthesis enzyme